MEFAVSFCDRLINRTLFSHCMLVLCVCAAGIYRYTVNYFRLLFKCNYSLLLVACDFLRTEQLLPWVRSQSMCLCDLKSDWLKTHQEFWQFRCDAKCQCASDCISHSRSNHQFCACHQINSVQVPRLACKSAWVGGSNTRQGAQGPPSFHASEKSNRLRDLFISANTVLLCQLNSPEAWSKNSFACTA